jgi:D-3-phosphoglycerate dehydrogenase
MILMMNNDTPGVIGAVGTILGHYKVNIAQFALGRNSTGAVGIVSVDDDTGTALSPKLIDELRAVPSVRNAWAVRV